MIEYETHKQVFMKIWGFLLDENARRIGVWGMGGVGKTTIMSEINNCLVKGSSQFNCTLWVEASKDLKKMQQDIAVKLGLTFQETDDERARASKLLEAFKRRKAFALILDDVWEPFCIEEVGIPVPTVENGCKLVITTRSLMVCRVMERDKDVEVKVLEDDEAWNLFKDKVGEELVLSDPDLQSIAMEVAKECGGLPLAIIAVGRALRNTTSIREWQNALEELRTSSDGIYNIDEAVCSRLKLSYSKPKDDPRRSCFLFCALYPKGHLIDENELINYWVWEDLLGDVNMSATKQKGQMIIDELISACLLELKIENGVRRVKLHDLIRDMAVKIMSKNSRCIVNAGMGQVRPPLPHEWKEDLQWVLLMRNDMKSIYFSPMCPGLTSLLLQYNSFEKNISAHFFDSMEGLKVLDLSYTGISALPMSLSNLKNLCPLILSHCWNLIQVPSLARLTVLKYLDFSFSRRLTELPQGMEQLTNLRHLDFSFTSVQNLGAGVVSRFNLLEDLLTLEDLTPEVVKPGTLMNLKSINVDGCSSLKCLFSMQLIFQLKSLEEITIFRCHAMEDIIEGERNTNGEDSSHADAAEVILPKLQRLKLILLPNLRSIYKGNIQCDSLRSIKIYDCISLNKLPLGLFGIEKGQHVSPSTTLEQITCQKQWWESLQWDQPQAKHLLQPYFVDHHRRAYSLRAAVVPREASI